MIIDFDRFVQAEKPFWTELDKKLDELERRVEKSLTIEEAKRFHYLYQRASADLARLRSFPAEPRVREHLESLVARAYAEVHEAREKQHRLSPRAWFFETFPQTFRRHSRAFALSVLVTIVGALFGAGALYFDPGSKRVLMPFPHLMMDPKDRVEMEESAEDDRLKGHKSSFSAQLMTHNTKVSIFTLGMGMAWGIGSIILLFYNGVILGAVCCDYLLAGEGKFLAGWLLPHGAIEIPAILIAGQAGLVLGKALVGWGTKDPVRARLRQVTPDLVTLIVGVALLLVWAGIVEAFFSQYHEPVLPYSLKIAFGCVEIVLLAVFLSRSGKSGQETREVRDGP